MAQKSVPLTELGKKTSVLGLLGIVENGGKVSENSIFDRSHISLNLSDFLPEFVLRAIQWY